ncbi:Protein BFR2 [Meyerozyma sp. JA9]|nr:Protein BFR2 [Meyerozyma sp. JA9]
MARTLGEKLADIDAPEDFDIENSEFHEFGSDSGSVSESEDDQEAREHYVPTGRSKLRSAAPINGKYKGSVVSRRQLNDSDDGREESEESEENDGDELIESESGSEIDGEIDDENGEFDSQNDSDSGESNESDSGESNESESDEDSENESDTDQNPDRDSASIAALLATERKHVIQRLSQSTTSDALKGYSIDKQQRLFDSIIEARMKIQKSLTNANTLPSKNLPEFMFSSSKYKMAEDACYNLLDSIFTLRSKLSKHDQISTEKVKNPKKRKLDEYVKASTKQDAILAKYREVVLNKWSNKIQNSSGSRALNDGKFKAINQSAEQQVANHLLDKERLIKRTKINRSQITPLGYEEEPESDTNDDAEIPKSKSRGEMEQIFDDGDFYRILLNDLVDKKIQTSNPTSGLNVALASRSAKLKNNVDTRASKGRKLRYHVQDPIANFDAPRGGWAWNDDQIDEFFASLLGQKVNMNEEEDEAEPETVPEDSISIFS